MGSYKLGFQSPNMGYKIVILLITPLIATHEPPSTVCRTWGCDALPFLASAIYREPRVLKIYDQAPDCTFNEQWVGPRAHDIAKTFILHSASRASFSAASDSTR